jgi:hypothetical protein
MILLFLLLSTIGVYAAEPAVAVEQAHAELWKRFIDRHGLFIDYVDFDGQTVLPTPEECKAGKPNALGWFQPIENGGMFGGLYMEAAINRWKKTRSEDDAAQARRLMEGLLFLNTISDVKGFVGRGVTTDGISHYPMGSNDQTGPWFYGLWRYYESALASSEEKVRIAKHLVETSEAIIALQWRMPAEPPFGTRGSFEGFHFEEASRQIFVLKLLETITADPKWSAHYRQTLAQSGGPEKLSKREILEKGMKFFYAKTHNWTSCCAVAALRGLWELETDSELKDTYKRGLIASADLAAEALPMALKYDPNDQSVLVMDWRKAMLPLWKPQTTEKEASDLADAQRRAWDAESPRRTHEAQTVREPIAAAWIVTLCPDVDIVSRHRESIEAMISSFNYPRLYYSGFFWAESAWYRLHP